MESLPNVIFDIVDVDTPSKTIKASRRSNGLVPTQRTDPAGNQFQLIVIDESLSNLGSPNQDETDESPYGHLKQPIGQAQEVHMKRRLCQRVTCCQIKLQRLHR